QAALADIAAGHAELSAAWRPAGRRRYEQKVAARIAEMRRCARALRSELDSRADRHRDADRPPVAVPGPQRARGAGRPVRPDRCRQTRAREIRQVSPTLTRVMPPVARDTAIACTYVVLLLPVLSVTFLLTFVSTLLTSTVSPWTGSRRTLRDRSWSRSSV